MPRPLPPGWGSRRPSGLSAGPGVGRPSRQARAGRHELADHLPLAQRERRPVVDEQLRPARRRLARGPPGRRRAGATARSRRSPPSSVPRSASIRSCARNTPGELPLPRRRVAARVSPGERSASIRSSLSRSIRRTKLARRAAGRPRNSCWRRSSSSTRSSSIASRSAGVLVGVNGSTPAVERLVGQQPGAEVPHAVDRRPPRAARSRPPAPAPAAGRPPARRGPAGARRGRRPGRVSQASRRIRTSVLPVPGAPDDQQRRPRVVERLPLAVAQPPSGAGPPAAGRRVMPRSTAGVRRRGNRHAPRI